jgi:hypothetical protein
MKPSEMMEMALEKLAGDMDDIEGHGAMAHSAEECPDPLSCSMHDDEHGDNLSKVEPGTADGVEIEIKKVGPGMPSMDGEKEEPEGKAEDGLSEEDAEELRKLLK